MLISRCNLNLRNGVVESLEIHQHLLPPQMNWKGLDHVCSGVGPVTDKTPGLYQSLCGMFVAVNTQTCFSSEVNASSAYWSTFRQYVLVSLASINSFILYTFIHASGPPNTTDATGNNKYQGMTHNKMD
jgi:hypothetical protein